MERILVEDFRDYGLKAVHIKKYKWTPICRTSKKTALEDFWRIVARYVEENGLFFENGSKVRTPLWFFDYPLIFLD